jgi:hypothetical protein
MSFGKLVKINCWQAFNIIILRDVDTQQMVERSPLSIFRVETPKMGAAGILFKVYTYLVTKIVTPQTFANRLNRSCVRAE